MAMIFSTQTRVFICTFLFCWIFLSLLPLSLSSSIHDVLRSKGLPAGLLPKEVRSYTLSENGRLEVFLYEPCLTKFENRVYFDSVVRANLTYGSLIGVVGLSQEELFLWLPVKDIIVDDPKSGVILFDIGVAHKQLSLSLFEDPPDCKPQVSRKETKNMAGTFPHAPNASSTQDTATHITPKNQNFESNPSFSNFLGKSHVSSSSGCVLAGVLKNHVRKEKGFEGLR